MSCQFVLPRSLTKRFQVREELRPSSPCRQLRHHHLKFYILPSQLHHQLRPQICFRFMRVSGHFFDQPATAPRRKSQVAKQNVLRSSISSHRSPTAAPTTIRLQRCSSLVLPEQERPPSSILSFAKSLLRTKLVSMSFPSTACH